MTTASARARGGANRKAYAAAVRLLIFAIISVIVTGTLIAIMGKFGRGSTYDYTAIFSSASMLQEGDDVRVAGVVLGRVKNVELVDRTRAEVTFSVSQDLPLTDQTRVEIRYLNLVGARYLSVLRGESDGAPIEPGATIPIERTTPALNLTALYDGFAPLFSALSPRDVNQLSLNLVQVLQGEGGTIEALLADTASLTSALADRDELVGQVITNLNTLLGTVDDRRQQLGQLVGELRRWVGGLAEDRVQIGNSIASLSDLTGTLADFAVRGRPLLKEDIAQLRRLSRILAADDGQAVLNQILDNLPEMLADQTRTGTYGSWYNYYVCGVALDITLPRGLDNPLINQLTQQLRNFSYESTAPRCNQ